jgi:hypothetical protein
MGLTLKRVALMVIIGLAAFPGFKELELESLKDLSQTYLPAINSLCSCIITTKTPEKLQV